MSYPITIHVTTSTEGLELIEALARRGVPAALVSLPDGWQVELVSLRERNDVLLHEVAIALESTARSLRKRSFALLAGGRRCDLGPRFDVAPPPLRAA